MATTFQPLFPLCPSLKQTIYSSTPWISSKPISDSVASLTSLHLNRQRGQVAASVAFNPSGNFDLSMYDDENGKSSINFPGK